MPLVTTKILTEIVKKSGDIKIPYIKKENPCDFDRIKIVKGKFSKIIMREECCAKDLTNENVCIGIYCIDNMLLCSNVQFIQSYCNSNEEHIEEVINIIKKREHVDINTLKIQLIQHIKVKRIRTPEDLKDINNYVDALTLI
jgi:bifunctional N-acetylglucosamine-1-phosphate-uridyltransferase/glucosamine-1-phosphate-acetyltransferase GlmU-like protein